MLGSEFISELSSIGSLRGVEEKGRSIRWNSRMLRPYEFHAPPDDEMGRDAPI
jgi:hypothetical protein